MFTHRHPKYMQAHSALRQHTGLRALELQIVIWYVSVVISEIIDSAVLPCIFLFYTLWTFFSHIRMYVSARGCTYTHSHTLLPLLVWLAVALELLAFLAGKSQVFNPNINPPMFRQRERDPSIKYQQPPFRFLTFNFMASYHFMTLSHCFDPIQWILFHMHRWKSCIVSPQTDNIKANQLSFKWLVKCKTSRMYI